MSMVVMTTKRWGECLGCGHRVYNGDEVTAHYNTCAKLKELEAKGEKYWKAGRDSEISRL